MGPVRTLLSDGRPHTYGQIAGAVWELIPPEKAARYVPDPRHKRPRQRDRVMRGRDAMIRDVLSRVRYAVLTSNAA